ncbi:hypothetical protein FGB62_168g05 [Gracilaria domingensis]|nr:hypothetical protein FGB62_168g05 [Gracilaria domingensis]
MPPSARLPKSRPAAGSTSPAAIAASDRSPRASPHSSPLRRPSVMAPTSSIPTERVLLKEIALLWTVGRPPRPPAHVAARVALLHRRHERLPRHARARQHAPPHVPEPHQVLCAQRVAVRLAADAVPRVELPHRRHGVQVGALRNGRAAAVRLHAHVRPAVPVPQRRDAGRHHPRRKGAGHALPPVPRRRVGGRERRRAAAGHAGGGRDAHPARHAPSDEEDGRAGALAQERHAAHALCRERVRHRLHAHQRAEGAGGVSGALRVERERLLVCALRQAARRRRRRALRVVAGLLCAAVAGRVALPDVQLPAGVGRGAGVADGEARHPGEHRRGRVGEQRLGQPAGGGAHGADGGAREGGERVGADDVGRAAHGHVGRRARAGARRRRAAARGHVRGRGGVAAGRAGVRGLVPQPRGGAERAGAGQRGGPQGGLRDGERGGGGAGGGAERREGHGDDHAGAPGGGDEAVGDSVGPAVARRRGAAMTYGPRALLAVVKRDELARLQRRQPASARHAARHKRCYSAPRAAATSRAECSD